MKKNLNRLLLLPVSAIAINQAQAMEEDQYTAEDNNNSMRNSRFNILSSQNIQNSQSNQGNINSYNMQRNINNNMNYTNEFNENNNQYGNENFNNTFGETYQNDNQNVMVSDVYNYIARSRMLTCAAAIHGGSIYDFVENGRINLDVLSQTIQNNYNGDINQAAKYINETVLNGIFQCMTIGEAFADAGLDDHSSIIQAVLKVAANQKKTIVPSLLRINLRSFGTLLNTELPGNDAVGKDNIFPYAVSVLTDKYLSLQGQDKFFTLPEEDCKTIVDVLEARGISLTVEEIQSIALREKPQSNEEGLNSLLNELQVVLGDTGYTSIKKELVQALDPETKRPLIQNTLQKSDSPVTSEVLSAAIEFYKKGAERAEKFKQGVVLLKGYRNQKKQKAEIVKGLKENALAQKKLKEVEIQKKKNINNIDEPNQRNRILSQNLNLNPQYQNRNQNQNPQIQNLNRSQYQNQPISNSGLQGLDGYAFQLANTLDDFHNFDDYRYKTPLSKMEEDLQHLRIGYEWMQRQKNANSNEYYKAGGEQAYNRLVQVYNKMVSLPKGLRSQLECEKLNSMLQNDINSILSSDESDDKDIQSNVQALLNKRNQLVKQQMRERVSGALTVRSKEKFLEVIADIDSKLFDVVKKWNGKNATYESLGSSNYFFNKGTTYGSTMSNAQKLH